MSVTIIKGNLFNSKCQTIVNTVNCVGVMGKGIALQYKKMYPDMFQSYKNICDQKLLEPGMLQLWKGPDKWVLNFPTKNHWRAPSNIDWVISGLEKFVETYKERGITSIAFPQLGCANGGLKWEDVGPLMKKYLDPLDIPVEIYIYKK
jgi:O-acetyl-ADP-ribose deacetylase (regulator of RNase III)